MKRRERIFQVLVFEATAIALLTVAGKLFTNQPASSTGLLAIGLSLTAMVWNYIFNVLFDRWYGQNRIERTLKTRIQHTLLFQLGMLTFSLPQIMWILKLNFVDAFVGDGS